MLRELQRRCFRAYYLSIKADADAAASLYLVIWLNEKLKLLVSVNSVPE